MSILARAFLDNCAKVWQPSQPCLLCGTSGPYIWCAACDAALPYLRTPYCPQCALPTLNGTVCGHCLTDAPHFQRTIAVFSYAFPLNKLIQALKFGERLELVNNFADKLAQRVAIRPDCIIAMPLHPTRLRERGFNQSLELARRIAQKIDIPILPNACMRVRDTPPQSMLSRQARNKNMQHAFTCSQDLTGQHVAIVDDVMTSGASLNEVARTLKIAGAREVSAWVVARTLPH